MRQAVRCLGVLGRAAIVALSREALSFLPYTELINKEAEIPIRSAIRVPSSEFRISSVSPIISPPSFPHWSPPLRDMTG